MKATLSCSLAAWLLVACVEPGPAPHDQAAEDVDTPSDEQSEEEIAQTGPVFVTTGLQNGVPVTGLAGAKGSKTSFTLTVPPGASGLKLAMSGGTGDADLYVRFGTPPTTSAYDYRPYLDGNAETVVPTASTAGVWYVMIRGYAAYSGVTLVASFQAGGGGGTPDAGTPDAGTGGGGGIDCSNAASWPAEWEAFEDQVLVLVNQRRAEGATCGGEPKPAVPPLVMDPALRRAARCHSLDMATHDYFSHTSQDGRSPWDRIAAAGYTAFGNAENIAAGQVTPADVMTSWMNSTGHCVNVMTAGSNEIGIGFAVDTASTYDRYWTQDFGKR